jgi:hypothetical protein
MYLKLLWGALSMCAGHPFMPIKVLHPQGETEALFYGLLSAALHFDQYAPLPCPACRVRPSYPFGCQQLSWLMAMGTLLPQDRRYRLSLFHQDQDPVTVAFAGKTS